MWTVKLGSHGTYVINKQTPNQADMDVITTRAVQNDFHNGSWVYSRTGQELFAQLQEELQQLLGATPDLS